MKIAIVHYHLKPGGITTVIKHQLEALSNDCEVLLLTGELPDPPIYGNTILIPELGYNNASTKLSNPEEVANILSQTIISTFGDKCDVLHIHNPLLAKNSHFLTILKSMQQKAISFFCKCMILRKMDAHWHTIIMNHIFPTATTVCLITEIMSYYINLV